MPYIQRNQNGQVVSLHQSSDDPTAEFLAPHHPDVLAFLYGEKRDAELLTMDLEFIRVIEDLIDLLVSRNLIYFTDLPVTVQSKLNSRQLARKSKSVQDTSSDIVRL